MKSFLRVWEEKDIQEIEKNLLVVGELSCECFFCHKIGISIKEKKCPNCGTLFKYMGFRKKIEPHYLRKIREDFKEVIFIDFEDFKKAFGKVSAKKILDI